MVPVTKLPSHLPDLCLSNIFKRVPLRDLLRSVRVVCTNWSRVAPTELSRRRELVLVQDYDRDIESIRDRAIPLRSELIEHVRRQDGSPWVQLRPLDQICFDALPVSGDVLTGTFTTSLMNTLPSITHLTVVQCDIPEDSIISILQQLVRLLNHYRDRMVSFKFDFSYYYKATNESRAELMTNCTSLFESINQLQSLRHLTLDVYHFEDSIFIAAPRLSILSRLDTFTSNYVYDETFLMDSIREHATGRVRIDWQPYFLVEELNALDPQLTAKFNAAFIWNHLTVDHYDNIRLFGTRFSCISRLILIIDAMPMTMLARCLSPQTQLVHLTVSALYIPEDEQPEPEYVQLTSVRLLSLGFITRSHLDTSRLHLAQIFPNLQVLSLNQEMESCDLCMVKWLIRSMMPN